MFKNPGSKITNVAAIFFALQILGLIGLTVYIVIAAPSVFCAVYFQGGQIYVQEEFSVIHKKRLEFL